ncbi:MAG: class I SAM-dependent methyltransferase [Bacteroidetes bacterium]|nr:class I SAM-dependent methyltransferase [Bacteroidota bacterium]
MQNTQLAYRYLKYLLHSNTKYGVHPPFLFNLVTKVFEDRTEYPAYQIIEQLKTVLLKDDQKITVTDYGAGSRIDSGNERMISNITRHTSKPAKYGRLLFRLVRYLHPENIIELGTSMGLSTAYMALGHPQAKVYTIEGCPNISQIAQLNFHKLNLKNIDLITGTFEDQIPGLLEKIGKTQFVFIDGNHRKKPTLHYFEQCLESSVNDTCLVFDDIHWSKEMESAWKEIKYNRKVTLSVDLFFMGLVFMKKELTKQDFVIRF